MKTKHVVLLLGAGALVWYLFKQTRRVDIGSASVSSLKITGGGVRLNISLPVINRSDFSVPISNFLGRLLYKGAEVGTITQVAPVTLPARNMAAIQFTTVLTYLGLAGPLLPLLNSLAKKYLGVSLPGVVVDPDAPLPRLSDLSISGTLYVGGVGIDINEPLTA